MSIQINRDKCIGCGRCIEACPGNLIKRDAEKKAELRRPKDCWGCTSCLKECSFSAIEFYLGADIGGRGSRMHTKIEGNLCHWIIESDSGEQKVITIDKKEANKY
ncbi:MAG: ferredoxin family protein [Lachnospiraceae bacterium]